jgi:phosphoglucomutase
MDAVILAKVNNWLTGNYDQETKNEIIRLQNENPAELTDSFYQNLEFGTGGLRGIMGVGTNRINKYTIGMATQGYSNYLLKSFPNIQVKVAVAHDSRNNSRFLAETAAEDFAANGIKVLRTSGTGLRRYIQPFAAPMRRHLTTAGTRVIRRSN